MVMDENGTRTGGGSADIEGHTKSLRLRVSTLVEGRSQDTMLSMADESGHDDLCAREQQFLLDAIREGQDLTQHMEDAVRSLSIVLAADRSMHENRAIDLE